MNTGSFELLNRDLKPLKLGAALEVLILVEQGASLGKCHSLLTLQAGMSWMRMDLPSGVDLS